MKTMKNALEKITDPVEKDCVISISELAWGLSRVLNAVNTKKKSVLVTSRGNAIALISPVSTPTATPHIIS